MKEVFLSASIPLPTRHRRFFKTADVLAIREALKALIEVVLPVGRITCGGHPAITPLLDLFVRDAGLSRDKVTIFQSRFFEANFPKEVSQFHDVRIIEAVQADRDESLLAMRRAMLNSRQFHAAVFIGGMEGILDEARLFAERWPRSVLLPIASTGAAAAELYHQGEYPSYLDTNLTYATLFRRAFLPKD